MDNDEILRLNAKLIEEKSDHKYLWLTVVKYVLDHRKRRYELVDEPNNQPSRIFICKLLATKVCKLNIVC